MRIIINILILIMLAAFCCGLVAYRQIQDAEQEEIDQLRINVAAIQSQVDLQTALGRTPLNAHGHPLTIDPSWFSEYLPRNPLIDDSGPWMEIADAAEQEKQGADPSTIVAGDGVTAGFWYNPRTGTVRARVPQMLSDQRTLEVYNEVNDAHLTSLFETAGR